MCKIYVSCNWCHRSVAQVNGIPLIDGDHMGICNSCKKKLDSIDIEELVARKTGPQDAIKKDLINGSKRNRPISEVPR